MHPTVRRTWAPRGRTPVLRQRTRHYQRVSTIGALSLSPRRRRPNWYLAFHNDRSIRQEQVLAFLRQLLRHLRGPVIVVWDRLKAHRGRQVREYLARQPRLAVEFLPAYAPELNPNEYGWAFLKNGPLANWGPERLDELRRRVEAAAGQACRRPDLLRGFVRATKLSIRL